MSTEQKTRDQFEEKDKWKLEDIFKTDADWENEFGFVKNQIPELAKLKGTLTSGKNLLLAIEQMNDLELKLDKPSSQPAKTSLESTFLRVRCSTRWVTDAVAGSELQLDLNANANLFVVR